MMKFSHNYWVQGDIINYNLILTKRGADTIYTVIPIKYHKYTSNKIINHSNVLEK